MLKICGILLAFTAGTLAFDESFVSKTCEHLFSGQGLSHNFNETIAHAIHSMTVQGLKLFNSEATVNNNIPTVNHDLSSLMKVLPYAPEDPVGSDFETHTMNVIDKILNGLGSSNDGLGPNWSATERIVHNFHMWDLWDKIQKIYHSTVVPYPPGEEFCDCLRESGYEGIYKAVRWVAEHYLSGTPITLLNRPIPKLTNAESWVIWKERLLHYYTDNAVHDAALYLYCELKDFSVPAPL